MAFSNSSALKTPTVLEQLLEEINFQRTKEMRQLLKDESGFVMLQGTTYWTDLFVRHFLFQNESTMDCDDLLFFVRKKHVKGSPRYLPKFETEVDVFRKDSRKLPIGDPDIDWEETVYLNLIIHQFEYTLTLAICTRTSPKELQVLKRHSQKVYASPSRRRMDTKGEVEEITYPHICFMVDNFDEVFHDILVRDGEMVCVELLAADRAGTIQGVIFLGSIRYDALKKVYDARQSSLSTKMAQRMTFGLFSSSTAQRCEFVRMKGPQGKGHAEMAVTKPKGSGVETPTSEPGFCATDMWDSDWEEDPEDFYVYRNQRRLSDPSANINNFIRGGWKSKLDVKARSESEGLDALDNGVSEIEAGDLRDETGSASTSNTACCGCFQRRNREALLEMYSMRCSDHKLCAERARLGPIDSDCAFAVRACRANKKRAAENANCAEYELADDAICLDRKTDCILANAKCFDHAKNMYITVSGKEELPCVHYIQDNNLTKDIDKEEIAINKERTVKCNRNVNGNYNHLNSMKSIYSYCTLPKSRRKSEQKMLLKHIIPPKRVTPDGTHIYYWCDLNKKDYELDDGAYNPLWTMRGFTQTFHFWKENKRAQSVPLNAFLTYITLPWWSIAKDILDHREGPILTF
ncbi:uncharacterized protein LOC114328942 isoform X1 [Diabrotica virgifera virgifera]|uniref:Uncharacterized protein LOC114328942 isoform X1 n=1 Tax=Diabrotica virgifera virgifera TaxID=50390 RepID=A0A6P7FKQ3_DIAVI|nr:uncharacterized protein LOC114328942 isoform X1 [Diabrotica virgifera virgifera]